MSTTSVEETKQIENLSDISSIADFVDQALFSRIAQKIIDYTEILSESKLSSIINHTYNLSTEQISAIIDFLVQIKALSRIYIIAQKGMRDLEPEYISNIFSSPSNPEGSSVYVSIRKALEIRLTYQIQQFNINMGVTNIAKAVSVATLRGQARTYSNMTANNASSKVQHGYITASLHDAYILLIPRVDFWNDKTYMKFFFNEDIKNNMHPFIITNGEKKTLGRINRELNEIQDNFDERRKEIIDSKVSPLTQENNIADAQETLEDEDDSSELSTVLTRKNPTQTNQANDPTMQTPFGIKYGIKINSILDDIRVKSTEAPLNTGAIDTTGNFLSTLFSTFKSNPNGTDWKSYSEQILKSVDFIFFLDIDIKNFSEKFLYRNRKETFHKFYQDNVSAIERFLLSLFDQYFKIRFAPVLKFIKTDEMMTFACAFIVKRIYIAFGDALTVFGFFLIKAILKIGKIHHSSN